MPVTRRRSSPSSIAGWPTTRRSSASTGPACWRSASARISWTWALHCLLGIGVGRPASPWLVDMLVALDRQLTHVERHLSYYFSPNTHLTGEALALYVVGTALPELAASARWAETGRRVLLDEIPRQILNDGGHVERSTHYQRYTLDFYLLATLTARLAGDDAAASPLRRGGRAAGRIHAGTMADTNGRLPLIGDDDGGQLWPIAGRACDDVRDSLAVAATVLNRPALAAWGTPEEVAWIAGPHVGHIRRRPPSCRSAPACCARPATSSHEDSMKATPCSTLVPHGYQNGGHAHADALSLTLSLDGRRLLIDPGTSTYTMDPSLRDRMRSTVSHNTVTLDGRSQSMPAGPFHWQATVDARVVACRRNPSFDCHRGVARRLRPGSPSPHRRAHIAVRMAHRRCDRRQRTSSLGCRTLALRPRLARHERQRRASTPHMPTVTTHGCSAPAAPPHCTAAMLRAVMLRAEILRAVAGARRYTDSSCPPGRSVSRPTRKRHSPW